MTHLKDDRGYSSLIELINGEDSIKWDQLGGSSHYIYRHWHIDI
jgi:hypothetical protein